MIHPRLPLAFRLASILALAFALRWSGRNWSNGHLLHPDERFMCMVTAALEAPASAREWFDTAHSPFNPYNRGFPSYVYGMLPLRIVHALAGGTRDLDAIARTGRLVSTLWDCGTVALLFVFALRLGGPSTASIVALLYALAVLPLQQSLFYTVDAAGVFVSTLCVGLGILAVRGRRLPYLLAAAAAVGVAMACRLNLGLLAFWVGFCALAMAWDFRSWKPVGVLAAGGLVALFCFRILQPYAFDATEFWPRGLNPRWLADIRQVRAISDGTLEVPFTLQWVDRPRWLYALSQIAAWGLGWPLAALAFGGGGYFLWRCRLHPWHWTFLLALWPVILIGYHGAIFLHTMRYFLPAYPALLLCGGLALRQVEPLVLRRIVMGLVTVPTALYTLAFVNMYRQPHPRVAASRWLYEHLPADGIVTAEHWDDALPLPLPGRGQHHAGIQILELPVYDPESPQKLRTILEAIDAADYVVLSSNRACDTLPRVPLRWPVMARFYERLLSRNSGDRIGLREVARFERFPTLGGWALDSHQAEEAFHVYDHPIVRIYQKTPVWHVDPVYDLLSEGIDFSDIPDIRYRHAGRWNNGWLTPPEMAARRAGRHAAELFPANGAGNRAPLAVWALVLFFLGPISWPAAWWLFPSLRDRGATVARLLGLVVIAWFAWLPAALGWLRFGVALQLAWTAWIALAAVIFAWRHDELLVWARRCWQRFLQAELVFWSVFLFFLWMRWNIPDLWHPWSGGEKPMDFAFLNATAMTPYFPPPNPWLSGAFINYYYYGFVLCAVLLRATAIFPSIAYNLLLPTFAALTAGAVYSIAGMLFPALRSGRGWRGRKTAGLLAVLFTLFLGNLGQLRWFWEGRPGFVNAGYWDASRVIRVPEGEIAPITEFPYFTLLYGDLHAHLMALPVAALCLLLSLQLRRRWHPLRLLATALTLGTLWATNAWDLPVQGSVLLFVLLLPGLVHRDPRRLWMGLGWALLALWFAWAAFLPYHERMLSPPIAFVLWKGPRSSLLDLLLAHGVFWIPLGIGMGLLRTRLRAAPVSARLLPLLLVLGSIGLVAFVELFTLRDDLGRMNTVFKFYYQAWWIQACVTAVVLASLCRAGIPRIGWQRAAAVVVLLCLLAGFLYPLTATGMRFRDRFWTTSARGIDGLAYLADAELTVDGFTLRLAHDLRIIRWLRRNARLFEVLIEAHRPEYQWGGRISWHTGLPTLLGWNWHMRQQRPWPGADAVVWRRAAEIDRFYRTEDPEEAAAIARRHRARYVVFGGLERVTYGPEAGVKFERNPLVFRPVLRDHEAALFEVL